MGQGAKTVWSNEKAVLKLAAGTYEMPAEEEMMVQPERMNTSWCRAGSMAMSKIQCEKTATGVTGSLKRRLDKLL